MPSEIPIVRTKIIIPRRRSEIISRQRLLEILDNVIDLKLLILAAPAGYGKTSLMIDFTYHTQLPVCWFALDTLDTDAQRFIAHFISSIRNRYPSFGIPSFSALQNINQDKLDLDAVITAIVNDCYENITDNFIFVLDDYHLVRDSKPIESFINRITQEMPENFHMIIASRTLLTLPDLSLLVARSQVAGLSFEELAFLPEEIKQLMAVNYHQMITDDNATQLAEHTEGWITGLLLTAQLSEEGTDERLRLERVSGVGLYEYLAQQVFDRQDEAMQSFLLRTSLLEEFNVTLCEKVIGQALDLCDVNWDQQVDIVQRDNLFVLPVEDVTLHLRYHHLFRDFLQDRMRDGRPDETLKIEKALAVYYVDQRDWERAMAIYSRIGNVDQITDLIRDASPGLILGGRLVTLMDWIDTLPEGEKKNRPEILSILGTVAMMRGAIPQSLELLNQAITGLRDTPLIHDLIASLIRRSVVYRYMGRYSQAMEDVDEALQLCAHHPKEKRLRAEALRVKGVNLYQKGELRNSLGLLHEALEKYQGMREHLDAAKVLLDLGVVHRSLGNLTETESCYTSSLEFWQKTQNSLWQSNVLNNLGVLQHMRGHCEIAMQNLERAVNYARLAVNPRLECYSLTSLGDLYRDIHAFEEAHKVYALARSVLPGLNDLTLQVLLNLSQCSLERCEGNYHNAHHFLNEAEKLAVSGGSKYEESLCSLEAGTLALHEHKSQKSHEKITAANLFFQKEGYKAEQLRAGFYLQVLNLLKLNSKTSSTEFHEWLVTSRKDDDQVSITRLGSENLVLLQNIQHSAPANNDLANFIERVKKYDHALIETRKLIRRHSSVIQFTTPRISIKALGRTQVKIGEQIVKLAAWKTQSVRDLFLFILQNIDGVTKDEIGEVFWPDSDQQTVRLRFKNSIYRVRHALGTESVALVDEAYRFNRTLDYDYDVEDFLQEIASAQATDDANAIQHYKNALAIYKGPFLPKIDYEWVLVQRESLHQKFLTSAAALINLLIDSKQYQQAIAYSHHTIELEPCSENAHRSAMVAYAAIGDKAGLVRQFEKCKIVLLKDLGVTPSSQTENLYRTLMN